jgi:putative nucleotidyltransferase with HDIG domain
MNAHAIGGAPASGEGSVSKYVREILDGHNLPSLPFVARKVLEMVKDPDVGMQKLCRVLANDAALTARVLAVSRSSLYGLRNPPTNLLDAVQVIGFRTLTSVVMANATQSLCIKGNKTSEKLWNHSLAVALAMRLLCQRTGMRDDDLAFLTGLMHDVGQIILLQADPSGYEKLLKEKHPPSCSIIDREQGRYGFDHCEIGFTLLSRWRMEPRLVQAVFKHHSVVIAGGTNQLAETLPLADFLSAKCGLGFFTEPKVPSPDVFARHRLESEQTTDEMLEQIRQAFSQECALFNAN